jgi:anti-sigma factor RsiW
MISDMKHPSAERLEAFAESTLPAGDRVVIESHVLGCPDCQTSVEEWRALFVALQGLPHFDPSPGFAERVMAGVHLAPARRRARGWSWQSAQAAVVAWGEETARAASRFLPRTTFGWAMATAFLSLPFVLVAAVMGWLVSKSYLTPQSLWAFASEQAAVGLRSLGETAVTTALQTNMAAWVVAQAVAFMERAGLPGVGVMLASAGLATVLSAWVLYRNLFRTPARDTNYASYSF